MRTIEELIDLNEPGWVLVSEWLNDAKNKYEILPKDDVNAEQELLNVQVTTRSPMGAVIYETGGILIDHGWLRILGSGSEKLNRDLYAWNKGKTFENDGDFPTHFLIADDVIGGYFALNAGGVGEDMGKVYYLAPDTLAWENLDIGYSEFLRWTLQVTSKSFMNFLDGTAGKQIQEKFMEIKSIILHQNYGLKKVKTSKLQIENWFL